MKTIKLLILAWRASRWRPVIRNRSIGPRDWLADPYHWAGYNDDPAEVETPTVWLHLPRLWMAYAYRWKIKIVRRPWK